MKEMSKQILKAYDELYLIEKYINEPEQLNLDIDNLIDNIKTEMKIHEDWIKFYKTADSRKYTNPAEGAKNSKAAINILKDIITLSEKYINLLDL